MMVSAAYAQSALPDCIGSDTWGNCSGTFTYSNGDRYVGEYKNRQRNGQGSLTLSSGSKYVGGWKDNKRNGQGTETGTDGGKYVGEFKDDKYHGHGTLTFSNGLKYVGEFEENKSNGWGVLYASNGSVISQGVWADGNLIRSAVAQLANVTSQSPPKVGDVFKDKFITEDGNEFPLPKGEWVFRQLSDGRDSFSVSWKGRLLVNLDQASLTPIIIIQYSTTSGKWREGHCNILKEKNNYFTKHGATSSSLVNKCSAFTFTNSISATNAGFFTGNREILRTFIKNYFVNESPTEDPLAISTFIVDRDNGKRFVLTTISTYPADSEMSGTLRFSKADSAEFSEIATWHDQYMASLEESLINKKFKSFAEFDASSNLRALFASESTNEIGAQKIVATLAQNTTQKDISTGQEDPFETSRKQAEKEFEEISVSQESWIREQEKLLAEQQAKEQIRLAEESRTREQLRQAQEARQKEQEKLLAEQQAKEQIRLAEEIRINNQQRLILESKEILRLRAEAEESKRKQAELEEQLKFAKQQNQVTPTVAMTTMANRKALVIGNDNYKSVSKLLNAREDAKAVASNLNAVGYQVTLKLDLNEKEMKAALRAFSTQVQGGDEVMFFFAGHGVQLGAANYLLPIDIGGESEAQVKDEAIQLQRVLDDMTEKKAKFTLAMIDACRDNPFKTTGRSIGGRGMAPTTAATGQMVVFSAGTGQQALDRLGSNDKNKNGVFTRTFLKEMQKSGVSIDRIVKNVRNEVAELAKTVGHEQVPAIYDQVLGDFYFKK